MTALWKVVMTSESNNRGANPYVNVFGYRSNIIVVNEQQELMNAFVAQVVPQIATVMGNSMDIKRVEVYNVTDGVGYLDNVFSTPVSGSRSGEVMPQFVAWGFQYNRVTAGKRNGYKRIGEISETDVSDQRATASALTALNALAVVLGNPLKIALIDTWFPEILERKPTGVFPWTSHAIGGVSYKRVTTQNSRKR